MSKKHLNNRLQLCLRLMAIFTFLWASTTYDVIAGDFNAAGTLNVSRNDHSVTLLHNGRLLIAGGTSTAGSLNSAEIYDPGTGTFSLLTGSMISSRSSHTATLLPDGKVLIAGGISNGSYLDTAEIYDPSTGSFSSTGTMAVLRRYHTATLLRNGKVLVAGGYNSTGHIGTAEEYDPTTGSFTLVSSNLVTPRSLHTATLMINGKIILIGGAGGITNTEIYDPEASQFNSSVNINNAREFHTATLLPSGQILIIGGNGNGFIGDAEIFDPSTNSIEQTGALVVPRSRHTATLRPDGKLVIMGGYNGSAITTHEIYDAASRVFTQTDGAQAGGRYQHSSSLLPDGKILSVGGIGATGILTSAEVYSVPVDGVVTPTGATLPLGMSLLGKPTATLLPDGTVLVVGGYTTYNGQIYDPVTGTFAGVDNYVPNRRSDHTATLLANGKVLIAGGKPEQWYGSFPYVYSDSYLYDPTKKMFQFAANMLIPRRSHKAFLLSDGRVLIKGGYNTYYNCNNNFFDPNHNDCPSGVLASEVYDPSTNTFSLASDEIVEHAVSAIPYGIVNNHLTNTLLLDGAVLNAGCSSDYSCTSDTEIFTPGFYQRPQISTIAIDVNNRVVISGVGFKGSSEASGGSYSNSATNFPILQLRDFDNSPPISVPAFGWDNNNYISTSINGLPIGYYQASIVTNGIPSQSAVISIIPKIETNPNSLDLMMMLNSSSGSFPVTINNNGSADLHLLNITFSINDGSFMAGPGSTCTSKKILPPGESCVVDITYTPQTTGNISAIMTIQSNDPHNPHEPVHLNASNYLLNLQLLGDCTGSVEVSSSFDATTCNDDCILHFGSNSLILFNPKPNPYCVFDGWGGECSGYYCHHQNNKNAEVSAIFIIAKAQLNQSNNNRWYATVTEALSRVYSNGEILIRSGLMDEQLNINTDKSITLIGGYDATFSSTVGQTSIGALIISQGKTTIDKIIIR